MSEVYESLMEGLNEALAFACGEKTDAIVHHIALAVEELDGATLEAFANARMDRRHDKLNTLIK